MYQLVSAIGKSLTGDRRWASVDISNTPLITLYKNYSEIIATLSNPSLTANVSLRFSAIQQKAGGLQTTFPQFLTANGNLTLPTSTTLPVLSTKYAHYNDGFRAGYTMTPIDSTASLTSPLQTSNKDWLLMTRDGIDYNQFYEYCLVNVNGFYHRTDVGPDGVMVVDGMKSNRMSHRNGIGIVSFSQIGALSFIPITAGMVYKQDPTQNLRDRCFINAGSDLSQKTVMLVLGGYLHVLDTKTFYRTGPQTFAIDFGNISYLDRFYQSKDYIDLSSLNLETTPKNKNQIALTDLFSDAAITAYCSLSQSFFVVIDNPDVFVEYEPLCAGKLPGMFVGYNRPDFPIATQQGKHPNYWHTYEDTQWAINIEDSLDKNYLYYTINVNNQVSLSDVQRTNTVAKNAPAWYVKIGSDFLS